MNVLNHLVGCLLLAFYFGDTSGCSSSRTIYYDIKTAEGFKFRHFCPVGSLVFIEDSNKTQVAHVTLNNQTHSFPEYGVKLDDHFVTIKNCEDLKIKCIVEKEDGTVEEACLDVNTNGSACLGNGAQRQSPNNVIIPIAVAVVITVAAVVAVASLISCCWKRRVNLRNQNEEEFQMVDLESQANGGVRNGRALSGRYEDDFNQNNPVESVFSGDTGDPDVAGPPDHRNVWEDPGGINETENANTKRELEDGLTAGDLEAEEHETKEPLLPSDQRAALRGFDMTGEAEALVNRPRFHLDHVSRCSSAPETDVESTYKEEQETVS